MGRSKVPYRRLNTTISEECLEILEKYKKEYGSQRAVIERALKLLDSMKNPQLAANRDIIWVQLRDAVDQVTISKRMLAHLMGGDVELALIDNASQYLITWYLGKPIEEATIDEVVNAIKAIYVATNVFRRIDVVHSNDRSHIQMIFWHTMDKRVSEFCAKYFKTFFENVLNCKVIYYTQNISFTLHIERP